MIWEKKLVGRPKGTDYSQSRMGAPGDKSPLLRSEGDSSLDTQAIIRDLDDEDGEDGEDGEGGDSINPVVALGLIAAGVVGTLAYQRFVKPKVDEYRGMRCAHRRGDRRDRLRARHRAAPDQVDLDGGAETAG
ncbi:hypothetical protein [Microbacterium sp. UBA837]|uniref:hypothetical protein n=1 Tax=Microbacterium sp. UBA837 TaxID=1946956 RepID=UPI0025D71DA4|nr:hypothetical protein [Microbacterium sp. UBA837]|tara:strand:+ start:2020 stop:2418 length:399 start_codon:yes stop_codon:yes gene_type:complete